MFIENTVAVKITISAVKTQAAIFKSKFGVKKIVMHYTNNNHWV